MSNHEKGYWEQASVVRNLHVGLREGELWILIW